MDVVFAGCSMLSVDAFMNADRLPLPQRLAFTHASAAMRPILACLFELDDRLARIVATVREPMLAQMRLAWWRDRLGETRGLRPKGDPVLDAIGIHWQGEEAALVALVDGWEELLGEGPLSEGAFERFADGKAESFAACARLAGAGGHAAAARQAGRLYALGDCLPRLSDPVERARLQEIAAASTGRPTPMPRSLRPLAILGGLGARVLRRGEGPLFGDRGSALLATRLGILGR